MSLNSPVGSKDASLELRNQLRTLPTSFLRSSGLRRETGTDPIFLNSGTTLSKLSITPLLRIQSRVPSISRARSSGVWFCLVGKMESIFRKTPVGSSFTSSAPLLRNHARTLSSSLALFSGLCLDGVNEPKVLN